MGLNTVYLACFNGIANSLGALAIHLTPNTKCGAEDFLHGALKVFCKRLVSHCPRNLDDLIKIDGFIVLDVLLLLTVPRGLLESLDD